MLASEISLSAGYQQLRESDTNFETQIIPASLIIPQPQGKCVVDGQTYACLDEVTQLVRRIYTVPDSFEQRLDPDAYNTMWRSLVANDASLPAKQRRMHPQVRVTTENEKIVGISDAKLVTLRNSQVIEAIEVATENLSMEEVKIGIGSSLDSHSWELQMIFSFLETKPREGDIVNGGLSVRFSPVGFHALQVRNFLHRCWCSNGAVIAICVNDKNARIRSRATAPEAVHEVQSKITKVVSQGVRELEAKLDAVAALTKTSVDAAHMISMIAQKNRLGKKVLLALKNALVNDESETLSFDENGKIVGNATYYEIWNALTRLATRGSDELLRPGIRERLHAYAGCFSQAAPNLQKNIGGNKPLAGALSQLSPFIRRCLSPFLPPNH